MPTPTSYGFGPVELHRADGTITAHDSMAEAIRTSRLADMTDALAAALADDKVHAVVATFCGFRPDATTEDILRAAERSGIVPAALLVASSAAAMIRTRLDMPSEDAARAFRHLAHVAMAADRDEPSPIRTATLTADELRVRRQAAALGILKGDSK